MTLCFSSIRQIKHQHRWLRGELWSIRQLDIQHSWLPTNESFDDVWLQFLTTSLFNLFFRYISLSVFFSMLSAMLVFPNFRCAMMYLKALEIDGPIRRGLDHVAFLLPAFILTSYSKPLVHQLVHGPRKMWVNGEFVHLASMTRQFSCFVSVCSVTIDQLDIIRIYLLIFWILSKFATRVSHLQAHLNLAYDKVAEMRAESGKVKNYTIQAMVRLFNFIPTHPIFCRSTVTTVTFAVRLSNILVQRFSPSYSLFSSKQLEISRGSVIHHLWNLLNWILSLWLDQSVLCSMHPSAEHSSPSFSSLLFWLISVFSC